MRLLLLLFCLLTLTGFSQNKVTVSGYLRDAGTGEGLIGATIYVEELKTGTVTNLYGYYALNLSPGKYNLEFDYLGYKSLKKELEITSNITMDIELESDNVQLTEVEITAEQADRNVRAVEMSVNRMDVQTVKELPQFMGEVDIVRSIQLLPGVSTVGEGASGFNVRGGNTDQNLILLDEATVFNSSHLFGFFSVFNADAVSDLTLYKGGIPSRYGGRLSSVLDVRQKEGNNRNFSASGGIGLISSRLLLEGPIVKEKASFMIAGRRSYADILAPLILPEQKGNKLYFYDLNAKMNYTINDRNRIFLSGYFGQDAFSFNEQFEAGWGNATATLRWNHLFGPKLFSNFTGIYSNFNYYLGVPEGVQAFEWKSAIENYNLKADFSWFPDIRNTIEFGGNAMYYRFQPGKAIGLGEESFFNEVSVPRQNAVELAAYIGHEFTATENLTFKYGLRYSQFMNIGGTNLFLYNSNNPVNEQAIIDTVSYKPGEVISSYGGFEPRFTANYVLNSRSSVKVSYNLMRQYLHLVSNTTAAMPTDIWTPAGKYVKPASTHQVAGGYFRNFNNNTYELSSEVYYKRTSDILDYKNGAELLLNDALETQLLRGEARSYGLEVQLSKKKGIFTGWISYTISRAEQQVPGINNNEYYPSNYDKLHDVNVVANYDLNDRWTISGIFAYMTGRPFTAPDSRYYWEGLVIPNYSERNNGRIPDYHRLDLAATYTPKKKESGKVLFFLNRPPKWESSWSFSLYNVYARRNAYSIYFKSKDEETPNITSAFRLSIFGSIIPSVTYNFKF